jgi:hypothetical protein
LVIAGPEERNMSSNKNFGPLPEGGEMLVLGIFMFIGVVGIIALMITLAPNINWDSFIAN